jgi:hypothetical protein
MVTGYLTAVLPVLGAGVLTVLGLFGSLRPDEAADLVGITPDGSLGRAEVRATYGGVFLGAGVACAVLRAPEVLVIAVGTLSAAVVRTVSVGIDGARSRENIVGIVVEAGIGLFLLVGVV